MTFILANLLNTAWFDSKDKLLEETRAQSDAMKEYNHLILSQMDEKQKAIDDVARQSDRLEETVALMKKAKGRVLMFNTDLAVHSLLCFILLD